MMMGEDFLSGNFADESEPDYCDPLQRLELIEKLESYADAELIYTRQLTARGVVRALQFVEEYAEAQRLLAIIKKIADDPDASLKADLLENIPQIAHFCYYNSNLFDDVAESPISEFVLPFVLKYVKESHNQVRKASQSAILYLLEQRIISPEESAEKLVPIVVNSIRCQTSDDIRADAANLMCKMMPVLGSELTESLLLESFLQLCTDAVFNVRKVCAVNIGDICCVLGQQRTEESVLAKFYALCEDSIWGVRKACCECFAQVSSVCTPLIRRTELSQLFINLIYDQSRWVRMAAFETLGSFIATFADPAVTGLYLSGEGVLDFRPTNGYADINLNIHEAKKLPQTTSLPQDVSESSDEGTVDMDVPRNPIHEDIGGAGDLSYTCSYYNPELSDEDVTPIVVELLDVVPVAVELIEDEDGDGSHEDCISRESSVDNSLECSLVADSGLSSPCETGGHRDDVSTGFLVGYCENEKHKLSLEMYSSEIDVCDNDLSVQCGSLELLCDNDDETDLKTPSDCQTTLHVSCDEVSALASFHSPASVEADHSDENSIVTSSDAPSSDSLAKMSADLEIMRVCDSTGLLPNSELTEELQEMADNDQFPSGTMQFYNSEIVELTIDHADEMSSEGTGNVVGYKELIADETVVEVLDESVATGNSRSVDEASIETVVDLPECTSDESVATENSGNVDEADVEEIADLPECTSDESVATENSGNVDEADVEEIADLPECTSDESVATENSGNVDEADVEEIADLPECTSDETVVNVVPTEGHADDCVDDHLECEDVKSVEQSVDQEDHPVTANAEVFSDEQISELPENMHNSNDVALAIDQKTELCDISDSSRQDNNIFKNEEEHQVMERADWFSPSRQDDHSIDADSSSFCYINSMAPRKMAVVESADRFISEDECRSKGVNLACLENLDESTESGDDSTDDDDQSVVPRDLLNHYLGMMDPSCMQTVDSEVTRHCAYSLPAVAFTLGRQNWSSLRNLYRNLCSDVQWKVRRTLASSMHELAVIVGEEITVRDLVPVFDQFLGDLDEVRIGVLRHLADFIKLLPCDVQHGYLEKLTDLLKVDNSHNWRFREELTNQLCLLVELYDPYQVRTYIRPMAFALADDKVSAVRLAALNLLCAILKHLNPVDIRTDYISELTIQFALSNHYIGRQMFVQLCSCIIEKCAVDGRSFTESFLQPLLALHLDPVPNVRIALARTIANHCVRLEQLCREYATKPELFDGVVNTLKQDADRDVRMLIEQAKPLSVIC